VKILILGANGFIGSHLCEHLLDRTDWEITAVDIKDFNLGKCLGRERFSLRKGDFYTDDEWIEGEVMKSDAVLPLVGIAKPAFYITNPVMTFHLDFEANLKIVRMCVKHGRRVIFPSTS